MHFSYVIYWSLKYIFWIDVKIVLDTNKLVIKMIHGL